MAVNCTNFQMGNASNPHTATPPSGTLEQEGQRAVLERSPESATLTRRARIHSSDTALVMCFGGWLQTCSVSLRIDQERQTRSSTCEILP